ncbi:MAG TPA: OstA family protein [Oscillatoriales cyanobacterium M59_W2019_021]|nr:MAG: OstA family protein [Cyanobacteria bacterium J055]HIK29769.1 OstA family protein [Oscillatoriales cyanobacterium M4454_W2019_049]HIK52695.1 OstA family protein [Oscillatoriales cyanobacterium M59_W2019_021]
MIPAKLSPWFKLRLGLLLLSPAALIGTMAPPTQSQVGSGNALEVIADIQEADAQTGIVTARGNVQINYPARNLQATSDQAQYFSNERRLVLSGNVYVLQDGNSIRGEVITYLVDRGLFVAQPKPNRQVESIYLIPEGTEASKPGPPALP